MPNFTVMGVRRDMFVHGRADILRVETFVLRFTWDSLVACSRPAREFREVTTLINIVGGNNNCEQRSLREYYAGEESFVSAEFLGTSSTFLDVLYDILQHLEAEVEVNAAGFFRLDGTQNDEYHKCEDLWLINTYMHLKKSAVCLGIDNAFTWRKLLIISAARHHEILMSEMYCFYH